MYLSMYYLLFVLHDRPGEGVHMEWLEKTVVDDWRSWTRRLEHVFQEKKLNKKTTITQTLLNSVLTETQAT